jgi:Ca2+-binding RTX toxin-like protein
VLSAIAEGRDIDEKLAETAAGLQADNGGIGNGFVRVAQLETPDGAPELDVGFAVAAVPEIPALAVFTDTAREGNSLIGSDGGQFLRGDAAAQLLEGGAGNDTLWGGGGSDVFRWEFGDQGSVAAPALDRIVDFDLRAPDAGGDVLELADLLPDAAAAHVGDFVRFESSGEDTMILINTSGTIAGGADQQILLEGVMFSDIGNDQAIINDLINRGSLVVD